MPELHCPDRHDVDLSIGVSHAVLHFLFHENKEGIHVIATNIGPLTRAVRNIMLLATNFSSLREQCYRMFACYKHWVAHATWAMECMLLYGYKYLGRSRDLRTDNA